ncbi:MAG TPA: DUF87 domain-containing protein [Fimbriimonas sp.]|nr:DUF87 domain-containing protein [Fimbriimonas sp.]
MDANHKLVIGTGIERGYDRPLTLSPEDRRQHLYVIGKSGVGKSNLLRNLILQDIEAGKGVGLIDPHGDLAADILDHIPGHLSKRVVYFDPSDVDFPLALNVLGNVPHSLRPLAASGIVSVFKNAWSEFWGPRLEYILLATISALLDCNNVSLLGVQRMLSEDRFRAWVVDQVKDPMVRHFWRHEFENYEKRFLQEAIAPIQNKVGQLLMSPQLRNILGQVRGKFDARFLMDDCRIFIASLPKGMIGEDKANLIGSFLVSQFELAAMSRADIPESRRRDFHLYLDEFQSYATESFVTILSEARKYRLCLTLAHQYMDQIKPRIRDAILGNVGSIVAFRVGHRDAAMLENAFGNSFPAERFTSLGNREIIAKLLREGQDREAIQGRTLPPHGVPHRRRDIIIQRSRDHYGTRREIVERRITQWLGQH